MTKALIKNPWTPEQMKLITRTVAKGATPDELAMFFNVAKRAGLDVFTKQIHFVKRNVWNPETKTKEPVGTIQVGVDGYRAIAERTGQLAGCDDVIFDDESSEHPMKAIATIYRMVNGNRCAFTASARWNEYAPQFKNKTTGVMEVSGQWQKMPFLMLGKCATSLALRSAFPSDLSGLYTHEEMEQAETPVDVPGTIVEPSVKAEEAKKRMAKDAAVVLPEERPITDAEAKELESIGDSIK